jgi:hypothetical protein
MKLYSFLLYTIGALCIVSCQKGYHPEGVTAPGTGSGSSQKLAKVVNKTQGSSEASSMTFTYDAAGKLSYLTRVETDSNNISVAIGYHYQRNASGYVTDIVTNAISAGTSGAGLPDSITIHVHYPSAGTANFDYTVYTFTYSGVQFTDSTVYVYAGNTITDVYDYQSIGVMPMSLVSRTQYAYTNSNIVTMKVFQSSAGSMTLAATYALDYDSKQQGAAVGNDAFLFGLDPTFYNANNLLKVAATDNTGAGQDFTLTYSYQYNSNNLPVTGTQTESNTGKKSDISFTYQ